MSKSRKAIICVLATLSALCVKAQESCVKDAFAGIWPVTDCRQSVSLNGTWNIKVVEGISGDKTVPAQDDTWKTIPVPGCWEVYGFCKPKYNSADLLTGYYRTSFNVPKAWRGQRTVLRFDGVLYGYDLWINGKYVGEWRSGYNTAQFDITPYLNKGEAQELAMRVITSFPGSDFDYNDDWAPCGIFRDVTLFTVPDMHMADFAVETKAIDENSAVVRFDFRVAGADKKTVVKADVFAPDGSKLQSFSPVLTAMKDGCGSACGGMDITVGNPELWTAETPRLYKIRYSVWNNKRLLQTFEEHFGIRKLTIEGNILKLNGRPIKLRGVTCHATSPVTGKVISDSLTLLDMKMMKEASVNYIRTSHYPREPRFYELADSLGFYVIDEVPFGYGDKNLSQQSFYPVLQQRAQATIRRDRNHASVLIWSLGNENPLTEICRRLGSYVKDSLDASRPVCYPQVGSYFRRFNYDFPAVADIYAPHYPTTKQIADFYNRADRPVIFTEYCHTLGISFEDHDRQWELIERTPCLAGGSVWEWVDQGMPFKERLKDRYRYEERVFTSSDGGFEMDGSRGTDGLLYADRTPLPNYYELQHNYSQADIIDSVIYVSSGKDADVVLTVRNRYDFIDLKDNITFRWVLTADRDTVAHGVFSPSCAPHSTARHILHLPTASIAGEQIALLDIAATNRSGQTLNRKSIRINPKSVTSRLLASLDIATGGPMTLLQGAPVVRAGRKVTMAEKLKVAGKRLDKYLLPISKKKAFGITADGDTVNIRTDIKTLEDGNVTRIDFTLSVDSTDVFFSELGIAILLDEGIDRVRWIGNGVMPTYPGRYRAGRYGFWGLHKDDLYFEGNRQGVDAALLTDGVGSGLLIFCDSGNISFEQTDRGIVLSYNAAVAGQGPKFSRTAFPIAAGNGFEARGTFYVYRVSADNQPAVISQLFGSASDVSKAFKPFETRYDTYLLRYEDIMFNGELVK